MTTKIESISLSNLIINSKNPRFEMVSNQREAIITMISDQQDKLVKLAEDIIENGMNPADLIIVIPHENLENQFYVLEGNRRITVLKLLSNPNLIPNEHITIFNKFKKLSESFQNNFLDKINCAIFYNEKDAQHWIKLKHTGENDGIGTVTWNSLQKARFDEMVDGKSSFALQILEFLRSQEEIDNNTKSNLKNVPISSLQRLIADKNFRKNIGIDIIEGKIFTYHSPKEIMKPLKKIINDLTKTNFTVKNIYNISDRLKYLKTFKNVELPDKTKKMNSCWELISATPPKGLPQKSNRSNNSSTKSNPLSTNRNTIIPKNLNIRISNKRINKLYSELKNLNLSEFSNSAAITFRVFIELSVDAIIEDFNFPDVNINDKLTKKIDYVIIFFETNKHLDKNKLKGIKTVVSSPDSVTSIDTFNSYVHNKEIHPDPNHLKLTWDNIEPFILKIWELI